MSRGGGGRGGGGRGGGRGGAGGSFIVQSYKNLMRSDGFGPLGGIGSGEDGGEQALYPPLPRRPAPPTVVKDLKFMVAAKRDLENRFCAGGAGARLPAAPNSTNFPAELDWLRRRRRRQQQQQASAAAKAASGEDAAKRRRRDVEEAAAAALLDEAVGASTGPAGQVETAAEDAPKDASKGVGEGGVDDEDDEDEEAGGFENDEELEDNDYVDAYFDNGEGYGADDGEEDMDGESWYY